MPIITYYHHNCEIQFVIKFTMKMLKLLQIYYKNLTK